MKPSAILFFLLFGLVIGFFVCMLSVEPVADDVFIQNTQPVSYPPIDVDAPLGVGLHTGRPAPVFINGDQSRDNYVLMAMVPLPDNGAQLAIIQLRKQTVPEISETEPCRDLARQMHIVPQGTATAAIGADTDNFFLLTQNIYRLYPLEPTKRLPLLKAGDFLNLPKPLYVNFAPLKAEGGTFK